jgi:hypothetical protein
VGAGEPVDSAVNVTEVLLPPVLQPATPTGFNVTTGGLASDKVVEALRLVQPVVVFVMITLYVPGKALAVKLETLPGAGAPAGTVHT